MSAAVIANVKIVRANSSASAKSVAVAVAHVTFHPGTHTVLAIPASPLEDGSYTVTFSSKIKSSAGVPLASPFTVQFAVGSGATWISPTSGNWNVGSNWLAGTPPQPTDDVVIAVPGVNVTFNQGTVTVASLSVASGSQFPMAGGSLTLNRPSEVDGVLNLTAGTLSSQGGTYCHTTNELDRGALSGAGGLTVVPTATTHAQGYSAAKIPCIFPC